MLGPGRALSIGGGVIGAVTTLLSQILQARTSALLAHEGFSGPVLDREPKMGPDQPLLGIAAPALVVGDRDLHDLAPHRWRHRLAAATLGLGRLGPGQRRIAVALDRAGRRLGCPPGLGLVRRLGGLVGGQLGEKQRELVRRDPLGLAPVHPA
jgi:hypothetical protein